MLKSDRVNLLRFMRVIVILLVSMTIPPNSVSAAETCAIVAGQIAINEILPAPSDGVEWVELYNKTDSSLDLSYCYIDDVASGGGSPVQIPAGSTISAHGFWTMDRSNYFNNTGDDVRFLSEDASTILDSYSYGSTGSDLSWYRDPDGGPWAASPTASPTKGTSNVTGGDTCGTGTWEENNLEIHHFDVGQGDATLIVSPIGKSLLFDTGDSSIGSEIVEVLGCKKLDYVVISHFHADHIGLVGQSGLWDLVEAQGFSIGETLFRDYNNYLGRSSGTFDDWKTYIEGSGQAKLHPVTAVEGTGQVNLGGGVVFDILTVDGNGQIIPGNFSGAPTPPSENDYSIGALISYGDFDEWLGGDLDGQYHATVGYAYHDIELSAAREVGDVDVYRVHHHGSDHSNNEVFVGQLDPEVSIISVGDNNGYGHPTETVVNRLLDTSDVYLTERGELDPAISGVIVVNGHIVVKTTDGINYTVNGTSYPATEPTRIDADGDGYFFGVDPNDGDPDLIPFPNGGCDPDYQVCSSAACQVTAGEVVINEILPAPSTGAEWVELYNKTDNILHIGYCYIDDIAAGGGAPVQIPSGNMIPAHGFWTLDRSNYFNNSGDDVRLLSDDATTILDSHTYSSTGANLAWYRSPDGEEWSTTPTASPTKGMSNTFPIVVSSVRADRNPINAPNVNFTVTFSEPVSGVDNSDFSITKTGDILSESVAGVSPTSGFTKTYTITVNTGSGNGTLRLDVVDDDSIVTISASPLGGVGVGNGNFSNGQTYTIDKNIPILLTPLNNTHIPSLRPTFDWEDIPAATGYTIQISRNSNFTTLVNSNNPVASTYTPTANLPANANLFWRVRTKTVSGLSGWSEVRSFTTPNPPSTPILLSPPNRSLIKGYAPTFKWKASAIPAGTILDHYHLQIATDSGFSTLIADVTVIPTQFTLSNELQPGATYYWRVMAYNDADEHSAWSSVWSFRTSATIFDNGTWWIKKITPTPEDTMEVYVNGVYWGKSHLVQFGHLKTSGIYPEAAAIYDNGYLRLVPLGLPYGTSFILGPAHWDSDDHYFHNLKISRIEINTTSAKPAGPLSITISARDYNSLTWPNYHFDITHQITFPDPTALSTSMSVIQTYTAAAAFGLSATRQAGHEGFKWAQFSSMYIDDYHHDSDAAQYRGSDENDQLKQLADTGCNTSVFASPLTLDSFNPWIQLRHWDSAGWQGNTPNTAIRLAQSSQAAQIVPQGYITCSVDPNDDNVGLWLNDESAPTTFNVGQTGSMSYTLIARDDPMLLTPILTSPAITDHVLSLRPTFEWNDVTDATAYLIQISKNGTFTQIVASGNASDSNYTPPTDLPKNIKLYWRVKATGNSSESDWSRVFAFTSPNPPNAPTLLIPASNALVTDYTPTFKWSTAVMPSGITFDHYQIQVDEDTNFSSPVVDENVLTLANPQFSPLVELMPNTRYYWHVRTYNTNGEYGPWSVARYFRTALLPPTLTSPANGEITSDATPTFLWNSVLGATNYTIQVSRNSAFTQIIVNKTTSSASYTHPTALPTNISLYWRVRANGVNGPSLWSSPVWSFTIIP